MDISHIRSLCQQLATPQFNSAYGVVDWMGMLQAQDYLTFPWAVGIRMKTPSFKKFKKDYDDGRIIRTHLFRQTWQLVTAADLPWMQMLYGERGIRGDLSWARPYGWSDEEYLDKLRTAVISLLEEHHSLTKEQFLSLLMEHGLNIDGSAFTFLMRRLEYEGLVCSGPWNDCYATFALQSERVPSVTLPSKEEAMAMLARKYFRSHAPATLDDFVWWTNLPKGECKQAIKSINQELSAEEYNGEVYYIHQDSRKRGYRSGCAHLLPAYDEYIIGYKSRHHVLPPEHAHKAHNKMGIFWPVIYADGKVVGNWNSKQEYTWFEENNQFALTMAEKRYESFYK